METTQNNESIVTVDDEIPTCATTLEAPPALRDLIERSNAGLRRVVAFVHHGKNNQSKLNAVGITGAKHGRNTDGDAIEKILQLLMRMVSSHLEDTGMKVEMVFVPWNVDQHGKSQRGQQRKITFDGIYDLGGANGDEANKNSEHFEMLRYLTAQNRHTLNVLDKVVLVLDANARSSKGQAAYTEVVVGRLTDALVREREATRELGLAQSDTIAISNEHNIEMEKLKQRAEFMEMFGPALQSATSKIGVDAASLLSPNKKKSDEAKKSNPLASMGKKKPAKEEADAESPLTFAIAGGDESPKSSEQIIDAEVVDPHEAEEKRLDAIKETHPTLYSVGMLRLSLTEDQEKASKEILGEGAWDAFLRAAGAENEEDTLKALVDFVDAANEGSAIKMLAVLEGQQQAVLGSLKFAVMQYEKSHPEGG